MLEELGNVSMARMAAILTELRNLLKASGDRAAKARRVAEAIRRSRNYRWVGIYEIGAEEIEALGWSGQEAPQYPRFPVSQGLCGAAARTGTPVLVGDVTKDPRYLTTFSSTRSEMIVPILQPATRRPIGLIDVESERVKAFGEKDRKLLENCAKALMALWG